jgi:thioredoxin 1
MIEVSSKSELASQLKANEKVVGLFYASWCPFCRMFLTVFEKYAQKTGSKVFLRINVDDEENPLWEEYDLEAVPLVILFEKEQVRRRLDCQLGSGLNEDQLSVWLQKP